MRSIAILLVCILQISILIAQDNNNQSVPIDFTEKRIKKTQATEILDIFQIEKIIPINSESNVFLKSINQCEILNFQNEIAVVDYGSQCIYFLDQRGSLKRTFKHKGRGPREYSHMRKAFQLSDETFALFDLRQQKLLTYNIQGDYLNEFNLEDDVLSICLVSNVFFSIEYFGKDIFIRQYNLSGEKIYEERVIENDEIYYSWMFDHIIKEHNGSAIIYLSPDSYIRKSEIGHNNTKFKSFKVDKSFTPFAKIEPLEKDYILNNNVSVGSLYSIGNILAFHIFYPKGNSKFLFLQKNQELVKLSPSIILNDKGYTYYTNFFRYPENRLCFLVDCNNSHDYIPPVYQVKKPNRSLAQLINKGDKCDNLVLIIGNIIDN